MAQDDMLTVFCYDVSADKKRRRVAKLLEDIANRVQFSVFETRMGRREAEAVSQRVAAELGPGCGATFLVNMRDIEPRKEDDGFDGAFLSP